MGKGEKMKHFFRRVLGFDDLKEKIEILEEKNRKLEQRAQEVDDCLFSFLVTEDGRHLRMLWPRHDKIMGGGGLERNKTD
jgi:hypothetical protein